MVSKKPVIIFIPGNVPSLKNNKQIITLGPRCSKCRKGKFNKLISSKTVIQWKKDTKPSWLAFKKTFLNQLEELATPYRIKFTFIRKSRHKFDYTNALDTVQDEMIHHDWLEDDNSDILIPVIGRYRYDKKNPGVYIKVLK